MCFSKHLKADTDYLFDWLTSGPGFNGPVVLWSWVRAALDSLVIFFVGVSLGKILQSPSLVLVKPRKAMKNVNCRHDMTEILLEAAINQQITC